MKGLVMVLLMTASLSRAASWTGVLVDSKCWGAEERNVDPRDTTIFVDRDRNLEIRFCAPKAKTKSFIVVPLDGVGLPLDSEGNTKAADLLRSTGKRDIYRVIVTGNLAKETLNVDSISLVKSTY